MISISNEEAIKILKTNPPLNVRYKVRSKTWKERVFIEKVFFWKPVHTASPVLPHEEGYEDAEYETVLLNGRDPFRLKL